MIEFLERIKNIKSVGRPSTCDFEMILHLILKESKDKEFVDGIKVYSYVSENIPELPRQVVVEVHENNLSDKIKYFVLKNGLESYEEVDEITDSIEYKSR